jgi:hypothetical protein
MKDMLQQEIEPGDFFLIPGGNPRFGGLILEIGIVLNTTAKMLKTSVTPFDKVKLRSTNKTSKKVLKLTDLPDSWLANNSVQSLLTLYQSQLDTNEIKND